jgi:hypothetical protein
MDREWHRTQEKMQQKCKLQMLRQKYIYLLFICGSFNIPVSKSDEKALVKAEFERCDRKSHAHRL